MRIILRDIEPDDFVLAARAVRWLARQPETQKQAVIAYGDGNTKDFYIYRNKSSITVQLVYRALYREE